MRALLVGLGVLGLAMALAPAEFLVSPRDAETPAAPRLSSIRDNPARLAEAQAPRTEIGMRARVALAPPSEKATVSRSAGAPKIFVGSLAPETSRFLPRGPEASRSPPRTPAAFESPPESEFEAAMAPVARLYLAYFQRLPDSEGFEYYIDERDAGRPLADIADDFAGSREFAERYGALDNAQFLDRIAQNVVESGRHVDEIDPEQRAQWLAQLDSGALTRGQVMLELSEGDGFRVATGDEVASAVEALLRTRKPR